MLQLPRIPELAQRDRFVRRAVKEGRVLTLADEESASVPSQKYKGATVQLFWSSAIEAKRWAEALTGAGDLQDIPLPSFLADILPGLAAAKGLAGTDWVADPIEAEIDPRDLALRLKMEAVSGYLSALIDGGQIYLVSGGNGPLLRPAERRGGGEVLAIFDKRADAERAMKQHDGHSVTADPVADFLASTLPWAAARGLSIALEPISGGGAIELAASDLRRRLDAR